MNKFFKIFKLLFLLLFIYSCGSVGEALQGKKRSDQGDEFLINKKNPLAMPPDFDKLPIPGENNIKSSKNTETEQTNIEVLLMINEIEEDATSSEQSTSIESSILKKIK
ncbi:DUF3035 domain-containing protein [Pelagibacterales bacterium SAG-MED23]|nr:DUF3035 domain-containing protein [Pelagibacterales bacterium SAG-MED23]